MSNQMEENRKILKQKITAANFVEKFKKQKISFKINQTQKVHSVYLSFLWSPVYKQTNTRIINRNPNYIWLFNATDTG